LTTKNDRQGNNITRRPYKIDQYNYEKNNTKCKKQILDII